MRKDKAEFAAKWWADKMRDPNGGDAFAQAGIDKNEHPGTSVISLMLCEIQAKKCSDPEHMKRVDAFEGHLRDALLAGPETLGYGALDVDYHPSQMLCDALKLAGLNPGSIGVLPCKTGMTIEDYRITVRCGYGAPREVAWKAPEETTP